MYSKTNTRFYSNKKKEDFNFKFCSFTITCIENIQLDDIELIIKLLSDTI